MKPRKAHTIHELTAIQAPTTSQRSSTEAQPSNHKHVVTLIHLANGTEQCNYLLEIFIRPNSATVFKFFKNDT
jgi:hypothetical protein